MTEAKSATTVPPVPKESERDELRAKIEARERRIAERTIADEARDAAAAAKDYTVQNPLKVVGGAIAVGLLVGLLTRRGRRVAANAATGTTKAVTGAATGAAKGVGTTVGNAAKKRSSSIGTALADAAVAYGIKLMDEALDGARAGQDKLEDISDAASAKAREVKRDAEYAAGAAADKSRAIGKRTRRQAKRTIRNITDRISS